MTNAEFRELCRATCLALDLQDTDLLAEQGQVDIDGISIGAYFEEESDTAIHCYVDLGPVDVSRKMAMYEDLLALNLELGRMHGETIGLDAETGRVVLRSEIQDPDDCDGDRMAQWFRDYARFATEFRSEIADASSSDTGDAIHGILA